MGPAAVRVRSRAVKPGRGPSRPGRMERPGGPHRIRRYTSLRARPLRRAGLDRMLLPRHAAPRARRAARALSTCAGPPDYAPVAIVGAGPTGLVLSSLLSSLGAAPRGGRVAPPRRRGVARCDAWRTQPRPRLPRPPPPPHAPRPPPAPRAWRAPPGVRHVVLERAAGLPQHPQAHFINHRTMEVRRGRPGPRPACARCEARRRAAAGAGAWGGADAAGGRARGQHRTPRLRGAAPPPTPPSPPTQVLRHLGGGLAAAVVRAGPPLEQWRRFLYCESMTGGVLGEVDHFPGGAAGEVDHFPGRGAGGGGPLPGWGSGGGGPLPRWGGGGGGPLPRLGGGRRGRWRGGVGLAWGGGAVGRCQDLRALLVWAPAQSGTPPALLFAPPFPQARRGRGWRGCPQSRWPTSRSTACCRCCCAARCGRTAAAAGRAWGGCCGGAPSRASPRRAAAAVKAAAAAVLAATAAAAAARQAEEEAASCW
jgi:hypothetical protein